MPFFDDPDPKSVSNGALPVTVFKDLSHEDWSRVMNHTQTIRFRCGETLIEHGDPDDSLYVLLEGEVEVQGEAIFGRKKLITRIPAGSVFGEIAFFDRQPRSAYVKASSDGSMLRITRQNFERLATWEPSLAHRLLLGLGEVMATRLRQTTSLNNG